MHDLIVYGSARIDAFMILPEDKAEQLCKLDTGKCVIELSYSAKLPLNAVKFLVGGNGANVAVGASRLGVPSLLAAELGEGPLADYAYRELAKELDMKYVSQTSGIDQGFGAVINYQGERTILSYYSPSEPPFPEKSCEAKWAYLTSTGENFEGYYDKVYESLLECKPRLAFNPGGRQIYKGLDWMKKFLELTDVLLVNREEAEDIVGMTKTHGKEKELLDAFLALGVKTPIITDGQTGSFASSDGKYYKVGILPIDAIERTGAGDSYSAATIAALVKGKSVPEAMLWGTINASSVIGFIGPEDGLLHEKDIPEWIDRAESSGVRVEEL